jgi:hypothetical protein
MMKRYNEFVHNVQKQTQADRWASWDRISEKTQDVLSGKTNVVDPETRQQYKVESGSSYYWMIRPRNVIAGTNLPYQPTWDFRKCSDLQVTQIAAYQPTKFRIDGRINLAGTSGSPLLHLSSRAVTSFERVSIFVKVNLRGERHAMRTNEMNVPMSNKSIHVSSIAHYEHQPRVQTVMRRLRFAALFCHELVSANPLQPTRILRPVPISPIPIPVATG